MSLRLGMPEFMVLFSIALLWHNVIAGSCVFAFAVLCGFGRFALELNAKKEREEATKAALQELTGQANELGEALGNIFSGSTKKKNTKFH